MRKLPTFSVDLIKDLDESFPAMNPQIQDTYVEIMYRAGQRSVIEHLKSRIKTAEDNILNNDD